MLGEDVSPGELVRLILGMIEDDEEGQTLLQAGESIASSGDGVDEVVSDNFLTLTTLNDFIDNFASYEFQYSIVHTTYELRHSHKLNYVGKENVDGVMADKVQVAINSYSHHDRDKSRSLELESNHVYDLWLDDDGMIIRIARDGEILTSEQDMGLAGGQATNAMLGPQAYILLNYQLQLTSAPHRAYVDWQLVNRTKINREISNDSLTVDVFDFQTPAAERKYFEIADVNGKNVYIGVYAEYEDGLRQFQVTRLIPR